MNKYAIVFSLENKSGKGIYDNNGSSSNEKMAIALSWSIRQYHKDVDIYCTSFTNNRITDYAKEWFKKLNVNFIEDIIFNNIGKDQNFCFLRIFCKDYAAKNLLHKYDYLIYLDIDVVQVNPIQFNFNPTDSIVLTQTMPEWVLNYHQEHIANLRSPLLFNWVQIINKHNQHIFDIDWNDSSNLFAHEADVIVSNRIHESNLTRIEQNFGGYHFYRPLQLEHVFYHYDDVGPSGTLTHIKKVNIDNFRKIKFFFETILKTKIENDEEYWIKISEEYK